VAIKGAFGRLSAAPMRMPRLKTSCGEMAAAFAAICITARAAARDRAGAYEEARCEPTGGREEAIKGAFERRSAVDMRVPQLRGGKRAR